jgi:response regulator of citrate/malate metabolism
MNLLIIDDDDICNFINNRVAQTSGIFSKIDAVHNGKDALEYLQHALSCATHLPDVILLDLNMPIVNGFDFIQSFRGLCIPNNQNIEIIILTSSNDSSDVRRARAMGIDHYLLKPLTVNQLQTTIFSLDKKVANRHLNPTERCRQSAA